MGNNEGLIKVLVVGIVFILMVVPVQAREGSVSYGGIEFPFGDESFADEVVDFNPGSGTGESDGSAAVGFPDGGKGTGPSIIGDNGDVTLGSGGSITLKFTDNYLIDVEGLDLYVFEYGPAVESFKVEISKDGSGWIDLGTISGQPTGLDIHGKVALGDRFSYVRITDANPYAPRDPNI
jgi:OOP family OmpA-OmpF porin